MASDAKLRGIADLLGREILTGKYKPGEVLPGEVATANTLGVSRGSYREAVRSLIAKGLVESRRKIGTRVLPRHRWSILDPEVLGWAFSGNPDIQLLRSLFELRGVIEPFAARLAAERHDAGDLAIMDEALETMQRQTLATAEGQAADRVFHAAILHASKNDALIALSSSIAAGVEWTTRFKQRDRALQRDPIPDHRMVFDRISSGNADGAASAMKDLVNLALDDTWFSMDGPISKYKI